MTGDDVRKAGFREKFRGYDPAAIDPLMENIAKAIDDGQSVSDVIRHTLRKPFPLKLRGYHPADVDRLLDRLRSA